MSLAIFRWVPGGSLNKFQGIKVLIDPFSIERFLLPPERLEVFAESFVNTNKIWLKDFGTPKLKSEIWFMC